MPKSVTLQQVIEWEPCYPTSQIREIFGERRTMTAKDIAELDLTDDDKVWALLHPELWDNLTYSKIVIGITHLEFVVCAFMATVYITEARSLFVKHGCDAAHGMASCMVSAMYISCVVEPDPWTRILNHIKAFIDAGKDVSNAQEI